MNINFVNNNGTQKDIATLGFAVKSSKYASLYGMFVLLNIYTYYDADSGTHRLSGKGKSRRSLD